MPATACAWCCRGNFDINTQAIPGGTLLTHGSAALAVGRPGLMVWLARDLVLTRNRLGKLATTFQDDPKVKAITLDEPTNDKSLVMTSSFTNLVLAARFLGLVGHPEHDQEICEHLRAG